VPLQPPPHDAQGVAPHNHDGILAEDLVIRRVTAEWAIYDAKIGGKRLSSMAFRKSSGLNGGMSIDLKRQIEEAGVDPKHWVTSPTWIGSVTLGVGVLRAEAFQVGYDPLPDNPYHGEVWGQFSKGQQKRLLSSCAWFVPIPDVALR
jgi:hypothetical protein